MKTEFETIDPADMNDVTGGGGRGEVIKKAAGWAWRNVIGPLGGGAIYDWATGGNQNQNQNQQPQQPQQ